MKNLLIKIAYPLMILLVAASCSSPRYASAQNDGYYDNNNYYNNGNSSDNYNDDADNYTEDPSNVNINAFTDALSPYGTWMVYQGYGRVWRPSYSGFVPYSTGGHWVYSSYGWTWASDYNWGWAPFHYGRWAYDPFYGWMWVPGYEWGPAWVSWRSGGGYYGWTPLGPGMSIGVNIGIGVPYNRWVFAPCRYMGYNNIHRYYVRPSHNTTIIRNTTIINNTTVINNRRFVAGPNRGDVERVTGRTVNPVRVVNATRPGRTVASSNTIQMYRPGVTAKPRQNTLNMQNSTDRRNREQAEQNYNRGRQEQVNGRNDYADDDRNRNNRPSGRQMDNIEQNDQYSPSPDTRNRLNVQRQNNQDVQPGNEEMRQQRMQQQERMNQQRRQRSEQYEQQRNEQRRQERTNTTPPVIRENRQPPVNNRLSEPQRQQQPSRQVHEGGGGNNRGKRN